MNVLENKPEPLFVNQFGRSEFQGTYSGKHMIQQLLKPDQEKQKIHSTPTSMTVDPAKLNCIVTKLSLPVLYPLQKLLLA